MTDLKIEHIRKHGSGGGTFVSASLGDVRTRVFVPDEIDGAADPKRLAKADAEVSAIVRGEPRRRAKPDAAVSAATVPAGPRDRRA